MSHAAWQRLHTPIHNSLVGIGCTEIATMQASMKEFIETTVDSPLKLDLLLFLYNNQFTVDTPLAISRRIGRNREEVEKALGELLRWNAVTKQETGGDPAYGYTQDGHVVKRIEELAGHYREEGRFEILTAVLERQSGRQFSRLIELQQRDNLKTQFLSMVSHELRTPLTTVKAAADTLDRMDEQLTVEQRREFLGQISEQTEKLIGLLNDILMVSEKAGGSGDQQLLLQEVDLTTTLRQVIEEWQPRLSNHTIEFDPSRSFLPTLTDSRALGIVLNKLIENAVKFSPDGGVIELSLEEHPEEVAVSIRDSGIGIAPDHLGRIFDEFYQVKYYATRRAGGCGLGLHIARRLTESMQGRITVRSSLGEGSVFSVFLKKAET